MTTNMNRIGEKAIQHPGMVFTSLYHHITDVDNLRDSYGMLDGSKATGIDWVSKEEYGKNLEENLRDLSARLRRISPRAQTPHIRSQAWQCQGPATGDQLFRGQDSGDGNKKSAGADLRVAF